MHMHDAYAPCICILHMHHAVVGRCRERPAAVRHRWKTRLGSASVPAGPGRRHGRQPHAVAKLKGGKTVFSIDAQRAHLTETKQTKPRHMKRDKRGGFVQLTCRKRTICIGGKSRNIRKFEGGLGLMRGPFGLHATRFPSVSFVLEVSLLASVVSTWASWRPVRVLGGTFLDGFGHFGRFPTVSPFSSGFPGRLSNGFILLERFPTS